MSDIHGEDMREKVYLETTVISYLTAWRSPQLLMAAHQEATRIWWDEQKNRFDIFTQRQLLRKRQEVIPRLCNGDFRC